MLYSAGLQRVQQQQAVQAQHIALHRGICAEFYEVHWNVIEAMCGVVLCVLGAVHLTHDVAADFVLARSVWVGSGHLQGTFACLARALALPWSVPSGESHVQSVGCAALPHSAVQLQARGPAAAAAAGHRLTAHLLWCVCT